MTSILDQYEQSHFQTSQSSKRNAISDLRTPYCSFSIDSNFDPEDIPICNITKLKINPPITNQLKHLAIGGEHLVFVNVNNTLFIFNWKTPHKAKEIDINKALGFSCKVNNLFVDPIGGHHILLSVSAIHNVGTPTTSVPCYLLYCNTTSTNLKLKQVERMKSQKVTAVAWNRISVSPQCTAPILLGTYGGVIFEIKLNADTEKLFQSNMETYCKELFNIAKNNDVSTITGIEFYQFSNTSEKYFVIVTTINRLYQFVGPVCSNEEGPLLSPIFEDYLKHPERFIEIPNVTHSTSKVHFTKVTDLSDKTSIVPKSFGWHVNGIGIIHRQLQLEWRKNLSEVCIQNRVLDYSPLQPVALSFVLTNFHALLLYSDRIVSISVLNKETVFIENYDENYGKFIDICKDVDDNIWILAERAIYRCRLNREDRFVWKIYLDMKKFSLAKEYCRDNAHQLFQVMMKEAEYYFDSGMFEESASLYSQIDGISFEGTALRFLQADQPEALKLYLMKVLDKLRQHESTHITMITLWLIEIYQKQLADAKFNSLTSDESRQLQEDFKKLLSLPKVYNCVKTNKEVTYKILSSHGDSENIINVAKLLKDYEKVVRCYIEEGEIHAALNILKEETVSVAQRNLFNSFMSKFISLAPKDTVEVLMKLGHNLEPLSILPSLVFPYDNDNQAHEVIRYLEFCIHSLHSHDNAIHNYLITLYAKYKPEKVLKYLATQGNDKSEVNYCVRYALKLCQEYGLTEACIQLSALLGLWESAVDLALTFDINLAKQTVPQLTAENGELCKKLWLKIAQHVVNDWHDIKHVMEFVKQCDLIKIEDILPFFDDFVTIDHFKDAICSSLEKYNQSIELLKEEMDDATKSADEIRAVIQSFKNRHSNIQSSDVCSSCNIQLLLRPFYVFSCTHVFHADCLIRELKPYLSDVKIKRIDELQQELSDISFGMKNDDLASTSSNYYSLKEQRKTELDSIIASECFFCGSIAVDEIDKPFIGDDEFEKIQEDWL